MIKRTTQLAFIAAILLFGMASFSSGLEALCTKCNLTIMTIDIRSSAWPGKANITVQLVNLQVSDLSDPSSVAEAIQANKITLDEISKTATVAPVIGENVTIVFNDTRSGFEQQICRKVTDSNGTIRCEATIGTAGCGSIIARYISQDPTQVPTVTSMPYCIGGEIPFGAAINATQCMTLFVILGLLVAALYATGKSPFAAIDITTPKRPGAGGYWPGYMHTKHRMKWKAAGLGLASAALGRAISPPITKRLEKDMVRLGVSSGEIKKIGGPIVAASVMMPNSVKTVALVKSNIIDLKQRQSKAPTRKARGLLGSQIEELEKQQRRHEVFQKRYGTAMAEVFKALFKPVSGKLGTAEIQELTKLARAYPEHYAWLAPAIELRPELLEKMRSWAEAAKEKAIHAVRDGQDPLLALRDAMKEVAIEDRKNLVNSTIPDELMSRFKHAGTEEESIPIDGAFASIGARTSGKLTDRYDQNSSREEELAEVIDIFAPLYGSQWRAELAREGLRRTAKSGTDVTAAAISVDKLANEINSAITDLERELSQSYSSIESREKGASENLKKDAADRAIEVLETKKAKLTEQCTKRIAIDGGEAAIKIAGLIESLNLKYSTPKKKRDFVQEGAA